MAELGDTIIKGDLNVLGNISTNGTLTGASDSYTKTEVDTKLNAKANSSDVYTKTEADTKINTKVNNAISSIEIGGRNLLIDSSLLSLSAPSENANWSKGEMNQVTSTSFTSEGLKVITPPTEVVNSGSVIVVSNANNLIKAGEILTFSIDIKGKASNGHIYGFFRGNGNAFWDNHVNIVSSTATTLEDWHRYSGSFTMPDTGTKDLNFYIDLGQGSNSDEVTRIYKNAKLERGNIATDWTPAPKDIFDVLYNIINQTKTELQSNIDEKADTSNLYTKTELDTKLGTKQDKLTAGNNITISNNTISAKDTTYAVATSSANGLMSKTDKSKLDGLSNYNDTTIKNDISALKTNKQDKLTAGNNITITNNTISAKDTTYPVATSSANGLMSKTDKAKLDGLSNYNDTTIKNDISALKTNKQDKLTAGTNVTISNNTISAKDTTYAVATSSVNGLMSKTDKAKLDGLSNYFVRMPYTLAKWAVGVDSESAPQYTPTDSELKTYMTTATSECGGKTPEQFISECLNNGYIMYYPSVRSLADRSSYYSHYFTIATVADYDRDYHRMWRYQFTGLNNNGFDFYIAWNLNEQYRWNEPFGEGGGGLACFTSDTLVLTEDGYKQIVNVKEGDKVYSLNENTNKIELKEIDKLVNHNVDDIYYVVLENELIKSSWSHPFYVEGKGKVLAKELKAGDNLKTKDGTLREIKAINVIRNQLTTVYEIRVKDNHNYYVGKDSILVYNEESIL